MTDEELKRFDLIVEHVNRAKIAASRDDEVNHKFHILQALGLIEKHVESKAPVPAA